MTTHWCLLFFLMTSVLCQQEIRKAKCGPSANLTVPLSCAQSKWIDVMSEQYSKQPEGTCAVGLGCRKSLSSHSAGLDVSCNGPVGESGVCREPTDTQRWLKGCVNASQPAAVEVRYKCVPGTDVMDICSNMTRTWIPPFEDILMSAYLATPAFPNTPALSQHCTCNITGQDIWILGLELKADIGRSAPWLDVLTVTANDSQRWTMGQSEGGTVRYLQEALLAAEGDVHFDQVSVSYRDYNLPGQLAWMRIRGGGDNLTISCQGISVPPPPSTTTTTTTTPIPTTTTTTPTPSLPPVSSSAASPSTTGVGGGGGGSVRDSTVSQTPPLLPPTGTEPLTSSTASTEGTQRKRKGKKEEHTGVIVGLVILMLVLISAAIVLGVLIWRRYQRDKKAGRLQEGGGGFGAFIGLQYWYNRGRHHRRGDDQDEDPAIPVSDFHNLEGIDHEIGGGGHNDTGHYEAVNDLDLRLRPVPPADTVEETTETPKEDSSAHVSRNDAQDHGAQRHQDDLEGSSRPEKKSSTGTPDPPAPNSLSGKKERFVNRVLDETLESIINQREALAVTPPSSQRPPPLTGPAGNAAASHSEGGGGGHDGVCAIPNIPPPPPVSKERREGGGDICAKPNKAPSVPKESREGGDIYAKPHKHKPLSEADGEGADIHAKPTADVYAKPNKGVLFLDGSGDGTGIYAKLSKHPEDSGEGENIYAELDEGPALEQGREEESYIYAVPPKLQLSGRGVGKRGSSHADSSDEDSDSWIPGREFSA